MELVPGPRARTIDKPVNAERPCVCRQSRRGLGGEDRPRPADVVLTRRQPGRVFLRLPAEEPSRDLRHAFPSLARVPAPPSLAAPCRAETLFDGEILVGYPGAEDDDIGAATSARSLRQRVD